MCKKEFMHFCKYVFFFLIKYNWSNMTFLLIVQFFYMLDELEAAHFV